MPFKKNLYYLLFIIALSNNSCSKNNPSPTQNQPVVTTITISSITPTTGGKGTIVTITGTNFSTNLNDNIVKFNGVQAVVQSVSATPTTTTIQAIVPSNTVTGPVTVATTTLAAAIGPIFTSPVISINSISPTSGGYDTVVTITGNNFSLVDTNNTVLFNGVKAVIKSASTTVLKVVVPLGAGTGAVSVATKDLQSVNGPVFTYNKVFTLYFAGSDNNQIAYWRNGTENTLFDKYGGSSIYGMTISGNDVYIAGTNDFETYYWKNGTLITLPTTNYSYGGARTLALSGSDLYVGGRDGVDACYWKNGVEYPLLDDLYKKNTGGSYLCYLTNMAISGSDIYFCAYVSSDNIYPVYWKNGLESPLVYNTSIYKTGFFLDNMAIVGSDVYFGAANGSGYVYWKNGVFNILPANGTLYKVNAMTGLGTDIYMAGFDDVNAVYWKNGTEYTLPKKGSKAKVTTVATYGSDVYFAGNDDTNAVYWKNGVEYTIPTASNSVSISAMAFANQ